MTIFFCSNLMYLEEQIDTAKPGSYIIINNVAVNMFKGYMRVITDLGGIVEEDSNPHILEVAEDKNLSLIEYEMVLHS